MGLSSGYQDRLGRFGCWFRVRNCQIWNSGWMGTYNSASKALDYFPALDLFFFSKYIFMPPPIISNIPKPSAISSIICLLFLIVPGGLCRLSSEGCQHTGKEHTCQLQSRGWTRSAMAKPYSSWADHQIGLGTRRLNWTSYRSTVTPAE